MGYMGFGMRKEDYKRKPQKGWSKQTEMYGNDHIKVEESDEPSVFSKEEILGKKRVKGLFEWKGFAIIKILVIFVSIVLIVNSCFG